MYVGAIGDVVLARLAEITLTQHRSRTLGGRPWAPTATRAKRACLPALGVPSHDAVEAGWARTGSSAWSTRSTRGQGSSSRGPMAFRRGCWGTTSPVSTGRGGSGAQTPRRRTCCPVRRPAGAPTIPRRAFADEHGTSGATGREGPRCQRSSKRKVLLYFVAF